MGVIGARFIPRECCNSCIPGRSSSAAGLGASHPLQRLIAVGLLSLQGAHSQLPG